MKWNWGWNIVLVLALFMTMIIVMVVKSVQTKVDLVTQDYYSDEIAYQEQIDKVANAKSLEGVFTWNRYAEGIELIFPEGLDGDNFKGTLSRYRPSDKNLDREIVIEALSNNSFFISSDQLASGKWTLKVDGKVGEKAYYFEQRIKL